MMTDSRREGARMFDDLEKAVPLNDDAAFNLLHELEQNRPDDIRRQRRHFRISIKAQVFLQSGNASEMLDYKLRGTTGDISEGGCSALFPIPIAVGDVYRLAFERRELELPVIFCRCVRCRLIRDDAYEAGFVFFSPISLPTKLLSGAGGEAR
jgi:hypothetical protein